VAEPGDIVRQFLESHAADVLELAGIPSNAPIDVIDAGLGTFIAGADKVLVPDMLLRGRWMEESVTYQEIIKKGKAEGKVEGVAEEAQRILLRVGTKTFGAPDAATQAAIAEIIDRERLEAMIDRVGEVKSWLELLAKPRSQRRNGRKRR